MDEKGFLGSPESEQEYRLRQAAKQQQRQKRRRQKILLLAAFALAALLLVLFIVLIFRAIFSGGTKAQTSSSSSHTISVVLPTSGPGISWPVAGDPTVWNLVLVSQQFPLPDGFRVDTVNVTPIGHTFDARAADALKQMLADCNAVGGHSLSIYSGYRGPNTQNERYNYLLTLYKGRGYSEAEAAVLARQEEPPAGYSEHQTGLAVDFVTGTVNAPGIAFAQTPEFAWLVENAQNYGFILRYPSELEDITGILVQPYHFRYVGVEDAKIITQAGICLEQYLAIPQVQTQPTQPTGANSAATSAGA